MEKGICLNRFFIKERNATKILLLRKRSKPQDLRQEDRIASCANAVRFIIRTALIYKTTKLRALNGKDKHQLTVLGCTRIRPGQ